MPNIEIYGVKTEGGCESPAADVSRNIANLIEQNMPDIMTDVVITAIRSSVWNPKLGLRPFIRVTSTNKKDRVRVAKLINRELRIDVEWLHLDGFFEGKGNG
jgi:hypothetical protein